MALVSLLARITKLGWFETPEHSDVPKEVTQFLSASVDHCVIGLQVGSSTAHSVQKKSVQFNKTE